MKNIDSYISAPFEFQEELNLLFDKEDKLIIFDIGACEGEDSIKFKKMFPNSKVFAFEPTPRNRLLIEDNIKKYRCEDIHVYPYALSNKNGKAKFHVSSGVPKGKENDVWDYGNKSSSLLVPTDVTRVHEWLKFDKTIEVQTKRLDSFMSKNQIEMIDFLYMDVQGAELMVLDGAGDMINSIKAIWLEVESVELYEKQPLKDDIEKFMQKNGFMKIKDTVDDISGDQLYIKDYIYTSIKRSLQGKRLYATAGRKAKTLIQRAKKQVLRAEKQKKNLKKSYSQTGEDIIVKFIFDAVGLSKPSYLDIGAHHPTYINNTALLYKTGCRGINVEPDPVLFTAFIKKRPGDINLNIGVSTDKGKLPFFVMEPPTLNTFSESEANKYVSENGFNIREKLQLDVDTIQSIVKKYHHGKFPDFLSIDVEGLDYELIKSINYKKDSPKVICVETITYSDKGKGVKQKNIINYLESQGYMVFADTYINTIFVRKDIWIRD